MSLDLAFTHSWPTRTLQIAFSAPTPGVIALFGASGAGKSTIALVVAGLLRPKTCRLAVDGEVLADTAQKLFVPAEKRRIGTVFQDARLFPHLTVAGNLRYGMKRAKSGPIGFDKVVELLGIGQLLPRRPTGLSGGERQRVAIGRALLSQPRLLVMDEPLASLDAARRDEILPYLEQLRQSLALPILYISHALDEVARLADTLVLVANEQVIASGPVQEVCARADLPLAQQQDAGAVLDCVVSDHLEARGLTRLTITGSGNADLLVPMTALHTGRRVRVRIPAGEVMLALAAPAGISVQNMLRAHVTDVQVRRSALEHHPTERDHPSDKDARQNKELERFPSCLFDSIYSENALVELALGQARLLARITPDAASRLELAPGRQVVVLVKAGAIRVLG